MLLNVFMSGCFQSQEVYLLKEVSPHCKRVKGYKAQLQRMS